MAKLDKVQKHVDNKMFQGAKSLIELRVHMEPANRVWELVRQRVMIQVNEALDNVWKQAGQVLWEDKQP